MYQAQLFYTFSLYRPKDIFYSVDEIEIDKIFVKLLDAIHGP